MQLFTHKRPTRNAFRRGRNLQGAFFQPLGDLLDGIHQRTDQHHGRDDQDGQGDEGEEAEGQFPFAAQQGLEFAIQRINRHGDDDGLQDRNQERLGNVEAPIDQERDQPEADCRIDRLFRGSNINRHVIGGSHACLHFLGLREAIHNH